MNKNIFINANFFLVFLQKRFQPQFIRSRNNSILNNFKHTKNFLIKSYKVSTVIFSFV
jgi:hypothetical protein